MAKYVIEIPDEVKWIQYIQQTHHGTQNLKVESVYNLTPYTEPDEQSVKNNNIHLCWSCQNSYPECHAKVKDLLFGDGVGNDNICCCNAYRPTESNASDEDEIMQKAHEEAWEFVRGLIHYNNGFGMDEDELRSCFGYELYSRVFKNLTYSEAKAKYEEWRKEKDEIHVGDEVEAKPGNKACVLNENPDGTQVFVLKADGTAAWWSKCAVHKTGKNHPEVVELLKKMKEE